MPALAPWPRSARALGSLALPLLLLACRKTAPPPSPAAPTTQASKPAEKQADLATLPYLTSTPIAAGERDKMGVTVRDDEAAYTGLTVYCSERTDTVRMIDMAGRTVHRITMPGANCLQLVPYDETDFLLLGHQSLARVDLDGQVRWHRKSLWHHDVAVLPDGDILALDAEVRDAAHDGRAIPLYDNTIVRLAPDGSPRRSHSLYDLLLPLIPRARLDELARHAADNPDAAADWNTPADVLHVNALVPLPRTLGPGRAGHLLISARHLDLLAIIDVDKGRVLWSFGPGELDGPHNPTIAGKHELLVFDNGRQRGWTRIARIQVPRRQLRWHFRREAPLFFSATRGSAQQLRNGNLLIAESDSGHLFEIDGKGRVVWEFWNPELVPDKPADKPERRTIYRAARIGPGDSRNPRIEALVNAARAR